jgi:acetyl-CoA carboxylase carboxyl transferase beta subunit
MSKWFRKKGSRIETVPADERRVKTEGVFRKCPECDAALFTRELEENLHVCRHCSHHFRIGARARLAMLYDEGKFEELDSEVISTDPLGFVDTKPYKQRLEEARRATGLPEAVINARGRVDGNSVLIAAMDFSFLGGSMGSAVGEKITRLVERAIRETTPVIIVSASGGARMQEGTLSLMQMAKVSAALALLGERRLPYISILSDPTTGGVTASFAMLGDAIIAEPKALIGFAGPRVIEQTIREKLPKDFQRSEFLLEHGMLDAVVDRRQMRAAVIRLLQFLYNPELPRPGLPRELIEESHEQRSLPPFPDHADGNGAGPSPQTRGPNPQPRDQELTRREDRLFSVPSQARRKTKVMTFDEALSYLLGLGHETLAMKLGVENVARLLALLGDPHESFPSVQIAGTNGKGSVAAMLDSVCLAAGVTSGLYTSPHLVSITERVRVAGADVTRAEFARVASAVRAASEELAGETGAPPTFFEQVTAAALCAFRDARVELGILETGLGGRLDATTAARARTVAITPVSLDHQEHLGATLAEIASEKAAVIKPETSAVVVAPQEPEAGAVILARCRECGVEPASPAAFNVEGPCEGGRLRVTFETRSEKYDGVSLALRGRHQLVNAAVAVALAEGLAAQGFPLTRGAVVEGLERARHPGRLERHAGTPPVIFDGAHNPAGARALREYLEELWRGRSRSSSARCATRRSKTLPPSSSRRPRGSSSRGPKARAPRPSRNSWRLSPARPT